ncbi:3-(3-hydroxyphenyl)propionate hydroxylase [Amycolatopsis rifamycinica]|uniref:3-(3-hydroxyphenyl)propionate hydroxylase n=1 Tax=Amycolatopsis rifamycinica TaxID=287986 RepID=A0A066U6Q5_9PSEU|nr:3-(3-hydroxyphenyl)propionate hydroxylase [Amycolatopsis rifamycinica]
MPVVIVGAGPTGLTAAALLGRYGVECLVLERWDSVYPRPRAVHLDDEVHRILGRLGLAGEFAAISRPCHGLRLLDPDLRVLAEFRRSPGAGRHGYPEANMFDQPDLEHLLRTHLETIGAVTLRGDTEVTGIRQDGTGVRVETTDRGTGERETIHAGYVLGCDGANSRTRTAIGATMADLNFDQRWLVVDIATTADLGQWQGVHQVCDPARAATYMRIGETRHRWEFRLLAGEAGEDFRDPDRLHPLIAPWIRHIPADDLEIVRVAEYTFRARVADRWRDRRVFLLGDAAHLTPPFIGQGMGAGLRDAVNLAWKLAGVLDGTLPESALGTYEAERKPHARAMIRRAVLVGRAMTDGGRLGDLIRRAVAPRLTGRVLGSETPALSRSALVVRPRLRRTLAGRLCPNALLDDGRRFDDVADGRFAVVTADVPSDAERAAVEERGAVLVTTRSSGELHRWLRTGTAVVRPDGTVLSTSGRLGRALPRLTPDSR